MVNIQRQERLVAKRRFGSGNLIADGRNIPYRFW